MIWWKKLLVSVYSIMLFLKTEAPIVIAKIVFLHKQTNIFCFKYKLTGSYNFTLRNITISQYNIYRKQKKKNAFFQKWGISVLEKWLLTEKK